MSSSIFLPVDRQDAAACQRAFDRVMQHLRNHPSDAQPAAAAAAKPDVAHAAGTVTPIRPRPSAAHDENHNQNDPAAVAPPPLSDAAPVPPSPGGSASSAFAHLNANNLSRNNNNNNNGSSAATASASTAAFASPHSSNGGGAHHHHVIPASELPRLFRYLGAVTAPETLETILRQFAPLAEITRTDALNIYGIWLRMVSVNEPPSEELLEQRVAHRSKWGKEKDEEDDASANNNSNEADEEMEEHQQQSGGGGDAAASSAKRRRRKSSSSMYYQPGARRRLAQQHWAERISARLSNTAVLWLGVLRTMLVMAFTLVHWFSVFFRDAEAELRCGDVGVGLDSAHTVLLACDLVVEYYKGSYRKEIRRALDDIEERNIQRRKEEHARQAAAAACAAAAAPKNNNSNDGSSNASGVQLQHSGAASSAELLALSFGSFGQIPSPNAASGHQSSVFSGDEPSSENSGIVDEQQQQQHHQFAASAWDEVVCFVTIFCLRPKNLLALIALVPIDLFLCAGGAVTAATVLNHFRLLSVLRNFIDINPSPTPAPLPALFVDIYYSMMPLWTMTYTFVVVSSVFAIVFIIFRNNNPDPTVKSLDFLTAFYLVVQTFTTVGYGDIELRGTAEMWFAVVLVLIGMITNAAVIGSLVALIQLGNATYVRGDKIRETHAVLHYFSIPRLLQLEILGFQEHVLFSDVEAAFQAETEPMPGAMRDAMTLQHRLDILRQIRPFADAAPEELFFLAKELVAACFKPEEYLSCCAEPHHGVRILLFGLVDRLDSRGRYIKTLRSGDCFGMDGILSGKDEEYNHKALSYCDLLVISYDDFHNLLEGLPRLREWIVPELRKIEQEADEEAVIVVSNGDGTTVAAADASAANSSNSAKKSAKVLRAPVSMIDTTGGNLSMVHDLRNELRVLRRGLQSLAVGSSFDK